MRVSNVGNYSTRADHTQITAYLALLPMGFTVPLLSPAMRCALTAPFHPYLYHPEMAIGGLFSVALSVGLPRLAVNQHRVLWSSDFPPRHYLRDRAIT
jgi:hypothetical protein